MGARLEKVKLAQDLLAKDVSNRCKSRQGIPKEGRRVALPKGLIGQVLSRRVSLKGKKKVVDIEWRRGKFDIVSVINLPESSVAQISEEEYAEHYKKLWKGETRATRRC